MLLLDTPPVVGRANHPMSAFSVEHLLFENPAADLSMDAIIDRLTHLVDTTPKWKDGLCVRGIAQGFAKASGRVPVGPSLPLSNQPVHNLVVSAICLGQRMGIESEIWNHRSYTGDLLWAGAAKITANLGYPHPNAIPERLTRH